MPPALPTLAERLGVTRHVSGLRMRAERLARSYPTSDGAALEDWLVEVANARGARSIVRGVASGTPPRVPQHAFSDEALVTVICMVHNEDRPQMLRLAAQLISSKRLDLPGLIRLAEMERTDRILASLANEALHVEPAHAAWSALSAAFADRKPLADRLLHWTRLAEPIPEANGVCRGRWKLSCASRGFVDGG